MKSRLSSSNTTPSFSSIRGRKYMRQRNAWPFIMAHGTVHLTFFTQNVVSLTYISQSKWCKKHRNYAFVRVLFVSCTSFVVTTDALKIKVCLHNTQYNILKNYIHPGTPKYSITQRRKFLSSVLRVITSYTKNFEISTSAQIFSQDTVYTIHI